jgi:hypothetical protein
MKTGTFVGSEDRERKVTLIPNSGSGLQGCLASVETWECRHWKSGVHHRYSWMVRAFEEWPAPSCCVTI